MLNVVKDLIIQDANEKGLNLQDDFKTRQDFMNFVIAFTIRSLMQILKIEVSEAHDIVFGEGSYRELCDSVWESLQAK